MLRSDAMVLASEFMGAEGEFVNEVVAGLDDPAGWVMMVVGGAAQPHLDSVGQRMREYWVVDPYADAEHFASAHLIPKPLHAVAPAELPAGPRLWLFTFNVFPYLSDRSQSFDRLLSPGDIAVITTWGTSPKACDLRAAYLREVFPQDDVRKADAASRDIGFLPDELAGANERIRYSNFDRGIVTAAVVEFENSARLIAS
jgi:hypothetical protein